MKQSTMGVYSHSQGCQRDCGTLDHHGGFLYRVRSLIARAPKRWAKILIALVLTMLGGSSTVVAGNTAASCVSGRDCTQNINTTSFSAPNYGYQPQYFAPQQVLNNPYFNNNTGPQTGVIGPNYGAVETTYRPDERRYIQPGWTLNGSPVAFGPQTNFGNVYETSQALNQARIAQQAEMNARRLERLMHGVFGQ